MVVLVDTGVLLRAIYRKDAQFSTVRAAARRLLAEGADFRVGLQQLAEFWNASTRPSNLRNGFGLSVEETARSLARIEAAVEVIIETPSTPAIWRNLVEKHKVSGAKVHDARIVALMLSHSISELITLNKSDFVRYSPDGVNVRTPEDVLAGN